MKSPKSEVRSPKQDVLKILTSYFLPRASCILLLTSYFLLLTSVYSQEIREPVFLAELPNPNDFSLFANGGWDGNWYVGFNTCWMQKIAVNVDDKNMRVFIGAKFGRMKNFQAPGKAPWERKNVPGAIYMAISSTPSWTRTQSFFLTSTEDIPLEPDQEVAYEGVGESRWFWTEVPLKNVNLKGDNYCALWSPSPTLTSASSAPILAAGWGTKDVNSWVSHEIKGMPPTNPKKALSTPITVFEPAIAIKLIPARNGETKIPKTFINTITDGKPRGRSPAPKIICGTVEGESIEKAWVEISTDSKKWTRYGRFLWNAPYCFTLKMEEVPIGTEGKTWVRIAGSDQWETPGWSEPVNLFERRE